MSAHILLIERDADLRFAIVRYLLRRGHRVTVCDSIATAGEAMAELTPATAPDAIMSDAFLIDGEGVRFFLGASRRFPDTRWIVTASGRERVDTPLDAAPAKRARVKRKAAR